MKDFFQHIIYKLQRAVTGQLITIGSKKLKANSSGLIVLFLLLTASCPVAHGQLYPVQVNQSIVPPYSTKLNSYATASGVKLRLYLTMTDVNINNRQVRLKLKIKGHGLNIQSADFVQGAPQIFLNGGMQQQLTNIDLAPYFEMNNLLGINPQQYNRPLPDGTYKFCWEIYDFLTGQLISNPNMGCDTIFLLLNDPPFLNLPNRGDQLTDIQPTNIIFQWTPRHANATNVSYEFELRELWDRQIDPQAGFMASPNYYTETTYATTLLYTIGKPTLLPGHTYAWRVRAKSTTGLSENSVFKNDGYSEIFHFTYTNTCYPPSFVLAEPLSKGTVKINWQTNPDHKKYHIQYKRADVPDAEWFEVFSYNNQAQISNLQAGVTYNFRVGGTCNALIDFEQDYSYSSINQFTTPTADESISYSCGIVPEIEITNSKPLLSIGVNETFTAGDFPVTVKEIEGGNGVFSGKGYIVVPYLADTKIAVTFSGIRINTDYQLFDGIIKTTYDRTWSGVADVDDLFNGSPGQQNTREVNFPIGEIIIDPNGDILVVGVGGSPIVEYAGGEDYIITDSGHPGDPNGTPPIPASPPKKYHVDEKGVITPIGEQATGGASTAQNTNGVDNKGEATTISAQGLEVTFTRAPNTVYGFDAYNPSYPETKGLYKKLGSNYYIPYKSVAQGQTDYIVANLNIGNDSIRPQDIIFKTKDGVAIAKVDSTGTNKITSYTLKLTGLATDANVETQAVIKQDGTYKIAGAFIQYQATSKDVNVVLVNTAKDVNIKEVKNKLIAIYKQAMVNLSITEINNFKEDLNELASTGTIDSGESGFLANYTPQQQAINSKIKSRPDYNTTAYYLILTDKNPSTTGQKGLMPLGRQFGYVYMGNADVKTPAHELGHGAFQLKHPFSTHSYGLKESTNWLMDYANGEQIPYEHWKEIHNPKLRIGVFDGDKEGEHAENPILAQLKKLSASTGSKYFAIRHCDECENSPKLQPVDGNVFVSFDNVSQDLKGFFEKHAIFEHAELIGYQLIFDGNNKRCFVLYYKENGTSYDNSVVLDNATFNIDKGLWFTNLESNEELNCSSYLNNALSSGICSSMTQINNTVTFSPKDLIYVTNLFEAINACLVPKEGTDLSISKITSLLQNVKSQSRVNQLFEFSQSAKVYRLNSQNQAEEVKYSLSDDDINSGNWDDESIDQIFRVYENENGVLQFNAVGIRNNIQIFDNKPADLRELSLNMKEKSNAFLKHFNVTKIVDTPLQKGGALNSDAFADGKKIVIKEDVSFFKIISEGAGKMGVLLRTGAIEESTYLESTEFTEVIHAPPLLTGITEASARVVTDITGVVSLVFDLSVDKEVRNEICQGLKQIKDQIAEDHTALFPLLIDVIVEEATGNSPEDWTEINTEGTDSGRKGHLISKGGARTAITVFTSGKLILQLPKMADDIAGKLLNAKLWDKFKKAEGFTEDMLQTFKKNLNELLEKIPESAESLSKIADFASAQELADIVAKLNKLGNVPGLDKVIVDMASQWTKFHGGRFVLDYFSSKIDGLGGRLRFEVPTTLTIDGKDMARIYDGFLEKAGTITKYELKNWSGWYPSTIKTQFIRDIQGINNLDELKWVFNSTSGVNKKNLKTKFIETLKKADGSAVDELKELFKLDAVGASDKFSSIFESSIENADDIIEALSQNKIFNKIFEIVE